ncbi:MAG: hypothetical protein GF405_07345 [Candidatus Eisenbacteria bacterium]|nr:hypothetical protein [Candidatus Eisenbacteria bacterium]
MLRRRAFRLAVFAVIMASAVIAVLVSKPWQSDTPVPDDQLEEWEDPGGRWHTGAWRGSIPDSVELSEKQLAELERLHSIGYLEGSEPAPDRSGVTLHDSLRAYGALNLYVSGHLPGAVLMDMDGEVLHRWEASFLDVWRAAPGDEFPERTQGAGFWRRAHLFPNGDIIGIFDWHAIVKLDRDSNVLWARFGGYHHDLEVLPDGRIVTLVREARILPRIHEEMPVLEDFLVVLDDEGIELERLSLLEAFERSAMSDVLDDMKPHGDIFHTNTVEVLDGRLENELPAFAAGNVLISVRELDVIAVVDMEEGRVVWALRGPWSKQHQPTVLDSGTILLFDNAPKMKASRVIEFDPVGMGLSWYYKGDELMPFFSRTCGSNQRLANGNTLITETDRGRAFEVTRDGDIVWEFVNPAQTGENRELIASLFEVVRLPREFATGWIE